MGKRRDDALQKTKHNNRLYWIALLCLFGLGLNILFNQVVTMLSLPLYLDTVGTIFSACLGGALPGIFVALFTNLILGFGNELSIYFGVLNVIIAVISAFWLHESKRRQRLWTMALFVVLIACVGGGIGAIQTWVFSGYSTEGADGSVILFFRNKLNFTPFWAQFWTALLYDLIDKAFSTTLCFMIMYFMPVRVRSKLRFSGWVQKPLNKEELAKIKSINRKSYSLGTKIIVVMMGMFLVIAVMVSVISLILFRRFSSDQHAHLSTGVAKLASTVIDPEMVDTYLEKGEEAEGYAETKALLERIRESYSDVSYLYVYRILEDGCQVVFDLDTEDTPGDPPGTMVEFDPSFEPYLEAMHRGEEIETVVSNDKYGWLITAYVPVYDKMGNCVCYAAADVSMSDVRHYEYDFLMKMASLFLGFVALLLAIGIWLSTYHLVYPIDSMAYAASAFAYDSVEARAQNVARLRALDVRTKDEIENLYDAFVKTTEDSEKYFAEMQHKTEMLSMLQGSLIMILADMVENRDQSTGDHVRKTSAYAKIILEKMREKGYYKDILTDRYISDVVKSAPLHDIGKIQVSDTILNKPGKLTDEEFEIMKKHTMAGKQIIEQTIATMPEVDYLKEAANLAAYHHEKWNGKGYPCGLKEEEIPLSARVMAVADVFDALISKRCYKDPFPFDKAIDIIREGIGTHFDPKVAESFLESVDQVREVAERFESMNEAKKQELTS